MKNSSILILGSNGQLGREFTKRLSAAGKNFLAPPESEFNITDFQQITKQIVELSPSVIINCAAYNLVDDAEENSEPAFLINHRAVENLAKVSHQCNALLVHYSTDYVFDGNKGNLYTEHDTPNPLGNYGKSKLAGEKAIQEILKNYLIFRTSWVFGDGKQNFIFKFRSWAEKNEILKISADETSVPTSTTDMVTATLSAIEKNLTGLYHLINSGYASRYEWARYLAEILQLKNIIIPVPVSVFKTKAQRPPFAAMSNEKLCSDLKMQLSDWKEAVKKYVAQL